MLTLECLSVRSSSTRLLARNIHTCPLEILEANLILEGPIILPISTRYSDVGIWGRDSMTIAWSFLGNESRSAAAA